MEEEKTQKRIEEQEGAAEAGVSPAKKDEELEWYYRPGVIALAVVFFGPLALPLIWFRPSTSRTLKVLITAIIIGLTAWMSIGLVEYYQAMVKRLREISEAYEGM